MIRSKWTFLFFLMTYAQLMMGYLSNAALAEEAWEASLRLQISSERGCQIKSISKLQRFDLGGSKVIKGHVLCVDEREFDFSWKPERQKFEITVCQPTVC